MSAVVAGRPARKWGRRVGRRFGKVSRLQWQAVGSELVEAAGVFGAMFVAVTVHQLYGHVLVAAVVGLLVAMGASSWARGFYPERRADRRAQMESAYEKGYRRGVRDCRRESDGEEVR